MYLHIIYILCILAGALGISAGTAASAALSSDSSLDACTDGYTATVYVTVSAGVSGPDLSKTVTPISIPATNTLDNTTNVLAKVSESTAEVSLSSGSISDSVVVVTSSVTVVPIYAATSRITRTTTLHSTRKVTQVRTVTKTFEDFMATNSAMFSSTGQDTTLSTITMTLEPTTTTLYLSLVKSVQIESHHPGSESIGLGSNLTPISKYPATTTSALDDAIARVPTESSFDLFQTSHSKISLSVMLAHSGFMNNPDPTPDTTLTSASAITSSHVMPESTLDLGLSETTSAALATPSTASVSSYATGTFTKSTAFSTMTSSIPVGSSTQYSSIPRYMNTTLTTMTSSIVPTSSQVASSPGPSQCGQLGDFTLQFDDIPPLVVSNASVGSVAPAPVFNPYHQFDFSVGFTVVPPPTVAYLPSSGPLLLEFIPSFVLGLDGRGPNTAEVGFAGQISDGDHGLTGCFTFNMYGATFGCNSTGPPCDFTFVGLHYDVATDVVTPTTSQNISISSCPDLFECHLTPIVLDHTFVNLNAVQIKAAAAGAPLGWWMDDLELGWFDNSCSAGHCRQSAHIRK